MTPIRIKTLLVALLIMCTASTAHSTIIYNVNRVIGTGSVTGTIETDGTIGVLGNANVTDWTLTLTSPNLDGGPVDVITRSAGFQSIFGTAFSATATELIFDFSAGPTNIAVFVGDFGGGNVWCLDAGGCGTLGPGELLGFNDSGGLAEKGTPSGSVVVASTAPGGPPLALPEPSVPVLFGFALIAIAGLQRKNRS